MFDPYHVSALCFPLSISKTTLSPLEFRGEQFYCYSTTWCSERYRSSFLNYFGYNWANPDFLSQTVLPSGETTLTGLLQEREETKNKRNWQKSRRPGKREALTFPGRRPTGCAANLDGRIIGPERPGLVRGSCGRSIASGVVGDCLSRRETGGEPEVVGTAASGEQRATLSVRGRELHRPGQALLRFLGTWRHAKRCRLFWYPPLPCLPRKSYGSNNTPCLTRIVAAPYESSGRHAAAFNLCCN